MDNDDGPHWGPHCGDSLPLFIGLGKGCREPQQPYAHRPRTHSRPNYWTHGTFSHSDRRGNGCGHPTIASPRGAQHRSRKAPAHARDATQNAASGGLGFGSFPGTCDGRSFWTPTRKGVSTRHIGPSHPERGGKSADWALAPIPEVSGLHSLQRVRRALCSCIDVTWLRGTRFPPSQGFVTTEIIAMNSVPAASYKSTADPRVLQDRNAAEEKGQPRRAVPAELPSGLAFD